MLTKDQVRAFRQKLDRLHQRIRALVRPGLTRAEFGKQLKTDDLNWPFPPDRLEELWKEFGPAQ